MPIHANAKKMDRKIKKRNKINSSRLSRVKTFIKKVRDAILSGNKENALNVFKVAQPEIQKAVTKNVFNKRKVSRIQSRLSAAVKNMDVKKENIV
ncbi:MAG: 30S ribosomal protein S20 [Anaplasmataceae bacterium]|nr:30S ribosomal protein S20 [Anaplasmataceae bacterium]